MTVQLDGTVACDADLLDAATGGDRAAFADIYDRDADRLRDYRVGIVGYRDAADCVLVTAKSLPAVRLTRRRRARRTAWNQ